MGRDRKAARHRTRALTLSVVMLGVGGMAFARTPGSAASLPKGHDVSWSADGWTLPPALDIEYNPYDKKQKCYGMTLRPEPRAVGGQSAG
ncbi:hypothetical protein [Streptomyces sp. NPDC003015]